MSSNRPRQRLWDILENRDAIVAFTTGMTLAAYRCDRKTRYAVTRALEIISEASRHLPDALKARHPTIDWAGIAAVGNIYRHAYDTVDETLVWHTIEHDIAPLRTVIVAELARPEPPTS
jgi:uncharacterized protein with HEPN domain